MYPTTNLQVGMSGSEVQKLQTFLIGQGMNIPSGPTGYFGAETKAALSQWQGSVGISPSTPGFGTNWGPKSIAVAQNTNSSKAPATGIPGLAGGQPLNFGSNSPTTASNPPLAFGSQTSQGNAPSGGTSSSNTNSGGSIAPGMSVPDMEKLAEQAAEKVFTAMIGSGNTPNPNVTAQDIANVNWQDFMDQASAQIAPAYKQMFTQATDSIKRVLGNTSEDYQKSIDNTNRVSDQNLRVGREDLAGRGLAFSTPNDQFIENNQYARTSALNDAATTAQRSGQSAFSTAEGLIGTSGLQNLGLNTSIGGRSLSFGSTPMVGSLNSDQFNSQTTVAKQLAAQEALRRGQVINQTSFQ